MQNGRVRLLTATALSLSLHGVWFAHAGGSPGIRQQMTTPSTTITRLSFATSKAITPPDTAAPSPQPPPPTEVEAETVTPKSTDTPPLPKAQPVKVQPKPALVKKRDHTHRHHVHSAITKPISERRAITPTKPVEQLTPAAVAVSATPPAATASQAPATDSGALERERARYLASLMRHIEKHKWYPATARRRGVQGRVKITFRLMSDGSVHHIKAQDGPKVLRRAAEQAVAKSEPMPHPPAHIHCPLACEFSMQFALN
ncbi:MAG: energy transducer TonB [Mariprofundales bacterium]|nr:energy transducer TonB [Mariprofundales bacterium]